MRFIDAESRIVIPGLWDSHCHIYREVDIGGSRGKQNIKAYYTGAYVCPTYEYSKECRELQEEQVESFFQAYFGPISRLEISPEIVVIGVKSQSLFMALGQIRDKPSSKYQI